MVVVCFGETDLARSSLTRAMSDHPALSALAEVVKMPASSTTQKAQAETKHGRARSEGKNGDSRSDAGAGAPRLQERRQPKRRKRGPSESV